MEQEANKAAKKIGIRHVHVLLLGIAQFLISGVPTSMSVTIIAMTDSNSTNADIPVLDWSISKQSVILSAMHWGVIVGMIPSTYLISKVNAHKLMCANILMSGLAFYLIPVIAMKAEYTYVIIFVIITSLGFANADPCSYNLMSKWVPTSERARLGGLFFGAGNLGVIFSMSVAGLLVRSKFGWPIVFYLHGTICLCWSILFYFLGSNSPSTHSKISSDEVKYIENSLGTPKKTHDIKKKFPLKAMLTSLPVWTSHICYWGHAYNLQIFTSFLPIIVKHVLAFNIENSGWIASLPFVIKWLFSVIISWFMDVALRRGLSVTAGRKLANTLAMWGPAAVLLGICFIKSDHKITIISMLVATLGFNSSIVCGSLLTPLDLCPNYASTIVTIRYTISAFINLLVPVITSAFVTDTSNIEQWHKVFYLSIGVYFFANLVDLIFGSSKKQPWND